MLIGFAILAIASVTALAGQVGEAEGAIGDLRYKNCFSSGALGGSGCADVNGAGGLALDDVTASVVTADGRNLYVASASGNFVARFDRNISTGNLTFGQCITGDVNLTACTAIGTATAGGAASGLDEPSGLAISPDQRFIYVSAHGDDSIAQLNRNVSNGGIAYERCLSGNLSLGSLGTRACVITENATADGDLSGLGGPTYLALHPDDGPESSLYILASDDDAISRMDRSEESGRLGNVFYNCDSGNLQLIGICELTPDATVGGAGSGMDNPVKIQIHPDGTAAYVLSADDDAINMFVLDTSHHDASWTLCLTGSSALTHCDAAPYSTPTGQATGLWQMSDMVMTPSGEDIYVAAGGDSSLYWIHLNSPDAPSYGGCITGDNGVGANPGGSGACSTARQGSPTGALSGFDGPSGIAAAGDSKTVYMAAADDDSVLRFDITPRTGNPVYLGCETGNTNVAAAGACTAISGATAGGGGTPLNGHGLSIASGTNSLYTFSNTEDSIAHISNLGGGGEPPPGVPNLKPATRPGGRSVPRNAKSTSFKIRVVNEGGQAVTQVRVCVETNRKRLRLASGTACRNLGTVAAGKTKQQNYRFNIRSQHIGKSSNVVFKVTSPDHANVKATARLTVRK